MRRSTERRLVASCGKDVDARDITRFPPPCQELDVKQGAGASKRETGAEVDAAHEKRRDGARPAQTNKQGRRLFSITPVLSQVKRRLTLSVFLTFDNHHHQ